MPIVEVTYSPSVEQGQLHRLLDALPHAVSLAVECPEEPYDGDLRPGDVEIRSRALGEHDRSGLDFVIEVRSKWTDSRARNRQDRCDRLCASLVEAAGTRSLGVYLSLPLAAWAQAVEQPTCERRTHPRREDRLTGRLLHHGRSSVSASSRDEGGCGPYVARR